MVMLETKLSRLQELIGKKLSSKELGENLSLMGFEVESVDGDEVKVDLTPDRPDLLSTHGLARALKSYLGIKPGLQDYHVENSSVTVNVDASARKVRPYTACAVVKGLSFDDEKIEEIIWVQEKMHDTFARGRKKAAIGIYPLEKIKPPIKYYAEDPKKLKFRPLESEEEMTGEEVLEKHPAGKAYRHLLEGHKKYPVFSDSTGKILSMPPIINSHDLGKVTQSTKDVFIEVSGHDLRTLQEFLNILVTLLYDMGGQVCSVQVKYPKEYETGNIKTPHLKPSEMRLQPKHVNDVLGTRLTYEEVAFFLKKMGHGVVNANSKQVKVLVPAYRADVLHAADLVDDVMRGLTMDKLKPELPNHATVGGVLRESVTSDQFRELMTGHGYQEVFTLALTNAEDQYKKMLSAENPHVTIPKAKAEGLNSVRTWLTPELLKVLASNRHKQFPQKVFDADQAVIPDEKEDVKSRNALKFSALSSHAKANYSEAKSVLESVCKAFNWKLEVLEEELPWCLNGRGAKIRVNGLTGWLGELHPRVLENFNLANPVAGFEFEVE